ncbi:hypothetical protein PGTUg99_031107 [Puccinia graminis f. sp. tritici]|uniref:Uncharacterized protein n=1 Tax=Puccinia graminis f. sp. tritici TaxID=56615 RepID=A0A5B0SK68_PUCGR|nr:hypothetical protein PGTUg99_023794 [Puccinia graminis f. sp. tritici]KAA1138328.1 hypothetical protein PGTUg99_031107 [Puccinia graminis f. sp. tritici]
MQGGLSTPNPTTTNNSLTFLHNSQQVHHPSSPFHRAGIESWPIDIGIDQTTLGGAHHQEDDRVPLNIKTIESVSYPLRWQHRLVPQRYHNRLFNHHSLVDQCHHTDKPL